jgi:hypothetical protein
LSAVAADVACDGTLGATLVGTGKKSLSGRYATECRLLVRVRLGACNSAMPLVLAISAGPDALLALLGVGGGGEVGAGMLAIAIGPSVAMVGMRAAVRFDVAAVVVLFLVVASESGSCSAELDRSTADS